MSEVKQAKPKTDWIFLLFLVLFTNQLVLSVKILGLVMIYLLRPNFKFGFGRGRMPKFYLFIIGLAAINLLLFIREFNKEYLAAFAVGNLFWVFSFLGYHQCKLTLERYGHEGVFKTLKTFIVLNFLFCLWQLGKIILITNKLNPYTGLDFPYGMSAGDNIYGTFMQNSYYNMMVSAMLTVYFIFKRSVFHVLLALTCLIMVFGNVGTLLFAAILVGMFAVGVVKNMLNKNDNSPVAKILRNIAPPGKFGLYIPGLFLFISVLYVTVSPENADYVEQKVQDKVYDFNPDSKQNYRTMLSNRRIDPRAFEWDGSKYDRIRQEELKKTQTYSYSDVKTMDLANESVKLKAKRAMTDAYIVQLQGKTLAIKETEEFLKSGTKNFLFGAGTTRFSSLTAQRMAGFDSSRLFMNYLPQYSSDVFEENHMLILESRMKSKSEQFSSANWPDSFYNQLLGEYGMLGLACFIIFYIGFFVRRLNAWSYGIWLVAMIIPFAHLVYMFETLCVMVFFELLMEADIKEGQEKLKLHGG